MVWFESLAWTYISFVLVLGGGRFWKTGIFDANAILTVSVLMVCIAALIVSVLLTARRGNIVTYWLSFVLFIQPAIKALWGGSLSFAIIDGGSKALLSAFPLVISFASAVCLLMPSNRVWMAWRRMEINHKSSDDPQTSPEIRPLCSRADGSAAYQLSFGLGKTLGFVESWTELKPDKNSKQQTKHYQLLIGREQIVPFVLAVCKDAGIKKPSYEGLDEAVLAAVEAGFKDNNQTLKDIQLFLIDANISWNLIQSEGARS